MRRRRAATTVCAGCRDEILDQYILRVSADLQWHVECLRCAHCRQPLDETCTCFVRQQLPYCKPDYVRYIILCTESNVPFDAMCYGFQLAASLRRRGQLVITSPHSFIPG